MLYFACLASQVLFIYHIDIYIVIFTYFAHIDKKLINEIYIIIRYIDHIKDELYNLFKRF